MEPVALDRQDARRIALRAQGFGGARTGGDLRAVRRVISRLHAIQLDSVNVLIRTQYLPLYSRVGPYNAGHLDRLAYVRRELFEHKPGGALCFFPTGLYPLFRWSLTPEASRPWVDALEAIEASRPGYVDSVVAEITERGPLAFTELADPGRIPKDKRQTKYAASTVLWSTWSVGDRVLAGLARTGKLMVAARKGFEPQYDLTERVIPPEILALPVPAPADAQRELVRLAVQAVGVGTAKDVAGYFRLPVAATKARLGELLTAGEVQHARVEGWKQPAFLAPRIPAAPVEGRALLSPFDSLLWERSRTRSLFDFEHVFELYVPAAKRRFGYYVLPFLLDEAIVARVDLKADRPSGRLIVSGAFAEKSVGARRANVAGALGDELRSVAAWLALDAIDIGDRGDLAVPLRRALGRGVASEA